MSQALLIDTHVWLWYAQGNRQRLTTAAARQLESLDEQGRLRLSVLSIWELGMLDAKNRIHLGQPCKDWLSTFFERTHFQVIGLDIDVALQANQLPDFAHADPVDRILVATTRHHDLTLISEDRKILDYARQGYVRACSSSDKALLSR
ncbi:MAG: type II toxin-antitoxin system VapC family toxin [Gammaproteobacteria bacterium]|nr:type II toxin-antitoxin system VapC family toxin [Gammaproteobacteria bacterium]MCF6363222.1 type II toxin-antitoxin system VapC family toxin [Gammaproteobacteria bacterium]